MIAASNSFPSPDDSEGLNKRIEASFSSSAPKIFNDLGLEDISDAEIEKFISEETSDLNTLIKESNQSKTDWPKEEEPSVDATNIHSGTQIEPQRWQDLMDHLNNLVRNKLSEGHFSPTWVASKIGITEDALYDYLNPNTRSFIGGYFLALKEILNIDERDIFDFYDTDEERDIGMESLTYYLSSIAPISLSHLLEHSPGVAYQKHLRNLLIQKLGLHSEKDQFAQDNNALILQQLDKTLHQAGFPVLGNAVPHTPGEQIFQIYKDGDFESFFRAPPYNSFESTLSFFAMLDIRVEELIPIRHLSQYESEELKRRRLNEQISNSEFCSPSSFADVAFLDSVDLSQNPKESLTYSEEFDQLLGPPSLHTTDQQKDPYQLYLESTITEFCQKKISLTLLSNLREVVYDIIPT